MKRLLHDNKLMSETCYISRKYHQLYGLKMQAEQRITKTAQLLFLKHIAIPNEHGSWVFLFSPMLIGLFAGGNFSGASFLLITGALAAVMMLQPMTVLVKILSKRRPRSEMTTALFWMGI